MVERSPNERRRDRAAHAVCAYEADEVPRAARGPRLRDAAEAAEALGELLCDLYHLADEFDLDWYALVRESERFHAEESERYLVALSTEVFQIRDTDSAQLKADVWASRADAERACAALNAAASTPAPAR